MLNGSLVVVAGLVCVSAAQADITVGVTGSASPWLGYMNVFELPSNGGGFVFGSPWGVPDLTAQFNDPAHTLTMGPNTIGDPNPFWYQGGGGPGHAGNKIMEANLYQETTGVYSGVTLNFDGFVQSNTFTAAHELRIFIRDFASDYSSVNETITLMSSGAFHLSLATIADPSRHVQYGIQVKGANVWVTDVAPFGTAVFATPAPTSLALAGLGGLLASRRRRA